MRRTLLSRFQGGFLGAALGEILATQWADCSSNIRTDAKAEVNSGETELNIADSLVPNWGRLAIAQMRYMTSSPSAFFDPPAGPAKLSTSSAGLAIALLPLAFFYHEDINLFHRQVQQRLEQWQVPSEVGRGAIVMGHAISLILREQFQPLTLIPQLLASPPLPEMLNLALIDSLAQVQEWLVETSIASQFSAHRLSWADLPFSASVSPRPVFLETIPIALALYAFLSTPEDFRLSLLRVAQFSGQPSGAYRLTCSLTAALSGAHNGRGSLPQDWRRLLRDDLKRRSPLSLLWDVRSESELLEYVDEFISAWSGIHNPMRQSLRSRTPLAVTIPRIIRPI